MPGCTPTIISILKISICGCIHVSIYPIPLAIFGCKKLQNAKQSKTNIQTQIPKIVLIPYPNELIFLDLKKGGLRDVNIKFKCQKHRAVDNSSLISHDSIR